MGSSGSPRMVASPVPETRDSGLKATSELRQLRYEPALDGIRGLGALMVVLVHLGMIVIPEAPRMPTIVPGAYVFMDVFFVVSGFLITSLLLREHDRTGRLNVVRFYRRRALRLLPALWAMLTAHLIWAWIVGFDTVGGWPVERDSLVLAGIHALNFRLDSLFAPVAQGLTHLWSLAIEEQFYLLWPLALGGLMRTRARARLVGVVLCTLIVVITVHRWQLSVRGADWMRIYTHTDTRADSVLIGALTAYLWAHRRIPNGIVKPGAWLGVIGIGLYTAFGAQDSPFNARGGFTAMAVATAMIVVAVMDTDWRPGQWLRFEPLRRLGVVSYSVYLWHVPIQFAVSRELHYTSALWRVIVSLAITAIAAALSFVLIERPVLQRGATTARTVHARPDRYRSSEQ